MAKHDNIREIGGGRWFAEAAADNGSECRGFVPASDYPSQDEIQAALERARLLRARAFAELTGGIGHGLASSIVAGSRWVTARVAVRVAEAFRRRRLYRRTVFALSGLDDRQLKDIGVSRSDIHGTAWRVSRATYSEPCGDETLPGSAVVPLETSSEPARQETPLAA